VEDRLNRYLFILYFSYAALAVLWRYIFDNFINFNGPELELKDYFGFASLMFGLSIAHAISFIPIANIFVRPAEKNSREIAIRYCLLSIIIESAGLFMIFGSKIQGVDGMPGEAAVFLIYFLMYLPGRFVFMLMMCGFAVTTSIVLKDDDVQDKDT
jgi:hypothetical protein